jgi:hypothetical protein
MKKHIKKRKIMGKWSCGFFKPLAIFPIIKFDLCISGFTFFNLDIRLFGINIFRIRLFDIKYADTKEHYGVDKFYNFDFWLFNFYIDRDSILK